MTITVRSGAGADPGDSQGHDLRRGLGTVHDVWVIARRGIVHMVRQPEALTDATIQPVMFVLLFAYVFGGAIEVPGGSYREFLMAGIFAQTIVFTAYGVGMAVAYDRQNGAVDRFRSLPMARSALIGGYAVANLIKSLLPIVLMSLCGLLVGWRIESSVVEAGVGYLLLFGFAFAMIWIGILIGSVLQTPEGVSGLTFVILFPLTFVASTFVPVASLPGSLRAIAEWNPVTTLADALRIQFGNPNTPVRPDDPWSIAHPLAYTVLWIVGIVILCAPLAVWVHRRSIER
jgi:ABC-2 type transport system permease protein